MVVPQLLQLLLNLCRAGPDEVIALTLEQGVASGGQGVNTYEIQGNLLVVHLSAENAARAILPDLSQHARDRRPDDLQPRGDSGGFVELLDMRVTYHLQPSV